MRLPRGTRLGTYEILDSLGAGGMGEVYRARDTRLRRDVAIKVLPEEVASDPDRLARLEREARLVAGLNHPNIVTLFSVEDEDGIRFLTMELVEGQTLSSLVTPGGLPLPRLLELVIPLADALAAAHERGVVHRDLKPGNVMVTREGRVKVLDFGLAKRAPGAPDPDEDTVTIPLDDTCSGRHVMGTLPYLAPEQLRGEAADHRVDLFALGTILYELATGRRPFTGGTAAEVISSILRDTRAPLTKVRADLPPDLERIAVRCLEKHPRERAQSALDLFNELRRLQRRLDLAEPALPETSAARETASIAVLPFVNRSHDEEDEYFSDGLADELLNMLAKIRGLRVVARASSFRFKGVQEDPAVIGARLNAATLLDGSVRKIGNRVRISVQLVNASDGRHVWSETYDRASEDIFGAQDDIAQSVVRQLRTRFMGVTADSTADEQAKAEVVNAAKGRSTDPEAHRLRLLARHFLDRSTREETAKGIEYLRKALELDPRFALAWGELGWAYATEAARGWAPVEEGFRRAREAVEHALSQEPDLAEGHHVLGGIRMYYDWDWRGAEQSYARALALAPGSARVLGAAGMLAFCLGRCDEAIGLYRRAVEQDPLSTGSHLTLGGMLQDTRRIAEAEEAYRVALELAPTRRSTGGLLSQLRLAQGRGEDALEEAMGEPEEWARLYALAIVHHALDHRPDADAALRELTDKYGAVMAFQIAEVHAERGETDAAFEWLERAFRQRDSGLTGVKIRPSLRLLHGDARWGVFMKKMGLKE